MSIELSGGLELSNAYYDEASGAIYAIVAKGNGCEGNLVVIPVETFIPPAPKPVVPPRITRTPEEPVVPVPVEPEEPTVNRRCRTQSVCRSGTIHTREVCWIVGSAFTTTETGPWTDTGESCG